MCRGKDHGNRRCPHDTSEARKRRRRAAQGRELYNIPIKTNPGKNNSVIVDSTPRSMKELRKEALLINALLHAPVNKDPIVQAEIDAKNELLVTRLGNALGLEAERRSGFDKEKYFEEMDTMPEDFMTTAAATGAARRKRDNAKKALTEALDEKVMTEAEMEENQKEIQRLDELYKEALEEHRVAQKAFEIAGDIDGERRERLTKEAKAKLLPAYKSVIADMREVGGDIDSHELSSYDAVETMRRTVGKHYPSTWIQASKDNGPVAIISEDNVRAHYNVHKPFIGATVPGLERKPEWGVQAFIPQSEAEEAARKLSEGNPGSVSIDGKPLDIEGESEELRHIRFARRFPFDPYDDMSDDDGKPIGEGWKYGYVVEDTNTFKISEDKVWYRDEVHMVPVMRGIVIPSAGHSDAEANAYHEAVHSFEDSVGDGLMMGRLQEAFLKRRTTVNGIQSKLRNITASTNLLEMEFSRTQAGLIHNYMGKEYTDQVTHREVLSTGAETLFDGKYGAFVSLQRHYREDLDHRAFTLGMFASA